jgi:hypothetical protein
VFIGMAAANLNGSASRSDEEFGDFMTLKIRPAAHTVIPAYTFGDTRSDQTTLAEERREIVDAVRVALSRSPSADCLAACAVLLRQLEQRSGIM